MKKKICFDIYKAGDRMFSHFASSDIILITMAPLYATYKDGTYVININATFRRDLRNYGIYLAESTLKQKFSYFASLGIFRKHSPKTFVLNEVFYSPIISDTTEL